MLIDAVAEAAVTYSLPDGDSGPAYEVKLDYDFNIRFVGHQHGTQMAYPLEEYFAPEFMATLRARREYESPSFKMRHLGFADTRTVNGRTYTHCDKVLIYDIDQFDAPIAQLAASLLANAAGVDSIVAGIDDLEITAHIIESVPVFGAAKLDIKGKYNGINVKAGVDYIP